MNTAATTFKMLAAVAPMIRWSEKQGRYIVKGNLRIIRNLTLAEYDMVAASGRENGYDVVGQRDDMADASLLTKLHQVA